VGTAQYATLKVIDRGSTIQFFAEGHNLYSDEVTITYTSPIIVVSEEGYLYPTNEDEDRGLPGYGAVLIALTVMMLLLLLGLIYYLVRGRSITSDLTRQQSKGYDVML